MKICISKIKATVFASVLGILALGSSNSFATVHIGGSTFGQIPGIGEPSLPAFGTSVDVKFTKGGSSSTLKATYNTGINLSVLAYPNKVFTVKNTTYSLNANFNGSGVFQNGTVSIKGQISGLGINTTQTLMTANLVAFGKDSSGYIYGFNTANIVCNALINSYAQCTDSEVVYLALFNSEKSLNKSWSTKGIALTSVPIPAAAWLFGSGLVGLAGVARRRKKTPA